MCLLGAFEIIKKHSAFISTILAYLKHLDLPETFGGIFPVLPSRATPDSLSGLK